MTIFGREYTVMNGSSVYEYILQTRCICWAQEFRRDWYRWEDLESTRFMVLVERVYDEDLKQDKWVDVKRPGYKEDVVCELALRSFIIREGNHADTEGICEEIQRT